jgi:hypothetical protein
VVFFLDSHPDSWRRRNMAVAGARRKPHLSDIRSDKRSVLHQQRDFVGRDRGVCTVKTVKVFIAVLAAALLGVSAWSQPAIWQPAPAASSTSPGGSSGQIQYNSSGTFAGMPAVNGDVTLNTSTGAAVVTKTNGTSFAPVATSGSASDLGTGTIPFARIATGTSSSTVAVGNDSRFAANAATGAEFDWPGTASSIATEARTVRALFLFPATIAASATIYSVCTTNPAANMSIVLKTKISGSETTACTATLSTSCVISGCTFPARTFAAGDSMTANLPTDTTAVGVTLGIPATKQ